MAYKKGVLWTGNAKGRPARSRALTEILALQAQAEIHCKDGTLPASHIVAKMLWEYAITGTVELLDGTRLKATTSTEWFLVAKFLYDHIDGPARSEADTDIEIHILREDNTLLVGDNNLEAD